jgi:glycosyltransferase involved in cell wall biosynthesis
MALAEALAAGLRAVVTDVGDSARLVSAADAGYCVPVGDWSGFARSLVAAMADDQPKRLRPVLPRHTYRSWRQAFLDFATALRSFEPS